MSRSTRRCGRPSPGSSSRRRRRLHRRHRGRRAAQGRDDPASGSCPPPTVARPPRATPGSTSPTAPLVSFLDGDDRWHPQLLQHLLTTLETAPPHTGAVFAHSRVMLASGRAVSLRWQPSGRLRHRPDPRGELPAARRQLAAAPPVVLRRGRRLRHRDTQRHRLRDVAAHRRPRLHPRVRRHPPLARGLPGDPPRLDLRQPHRPLPGAGHDPRPLRPRCSPGCPRGSPTSGPRCSPTATAPTSSASAGPRQALTAGRRALTRDHWGLSLLAWHEAGPRPRARMRRARDTLRKGFYRSADPSRGSCPPGRFTPRTDDDRCD